MIAMVVQIVTMNDEDNDSAVHRSRTAGAGVLTYFQYFAGAGAGAGVGSPPAALICAANYYRISAKKL